MNKISHERKEPTDLSGISTSLITLTTPKQIWCDPQPASQPKRYYRVVPGPIAIP
jgi:hypothetical protein